MPLQETSMKSLISRPALGLVILSLTTPAFAHVVLVEKSAKPGATFTAQFHVGHGCGISPTTRLRIDLPAEVSGAKGKAIKDWTLKTEGRSLTWTGAKDAATTESFPVEMKLPAEEGPLYFDVTQTCAVGESKWNERPNGDAKLTHPAPMLMVTSKPTVASAPVRVSNAWIRSLPAGLPAGGYFTASNTGSKTITLTGASSPACGTLMLHKSETGSGMAQMEHVMGIDIPAGGKVDFAPAGYHLMCDQPKPELKIGSEITVTLQFSDGTQTAAQFPVRNAAGK
jgi:copper(I)-binding protein